MDLADFTSNYLNKLLENMSKEQKSVFLLGDFNANLLNYNEHNPTYNSYILLPLTYLFFLFYSQPE